MDHEYDENENSQVHKAGNEEIEEDDDGGNEGRFNPSRTFFILALNQWSDMNLN